MNAATSKSIDGYCDPLWQLANGALSTTVAMFNEVQCIHCLLFLIADYKIIGNKIIVENGRGGRIRGRKKEGQIEDDRRSHHDVTECNR
jgi:hypothetical protein